MMTDSLLLTDLYQLRMIDAMWRSNMAGFSRQSYFQMFFRKAPYKEKLAVVAGTQVFLDYLEEAKVSAEDAAYLIHLGIDKELVTILRETPFHKGVEVYALEEGRLVGAREPIVRIEAPFWKAQLLETALLNLMNFQILIATKAQRICKAANGKPVFEFGLRRAQGPNGGLLASRAAIIGGCTATSNVQAGLRYNLPVVGTHAHSWVMAHDTELEAFENFARTNPENCTLLIDTYSVADGIQNAIKAAKTLKSLGHALKGVRIDSGDLVSLSRFARNELDKAGLQETKIVVSNDLDEYKIELLEQSKAPIDCYGVGTALVTGGEQAALGGVYKLVGYRKADNTLVGVSKKSEDVAKRTLGFPQSNLRFECPTTYKMYAHVIDYVHGPVDAKILDENGAYVTLPDGAKAYEYLLDAFPKGGRSERFQREVKYISEFRRKNEQKYTDAFQGVFVSECLMDKMKTL